MAEKNKELRVSDKPPVLNFTEAYGTIMGLIRDQAMLDPGATDVANLKSLQLSRAKVQSYLEAVFNVVQLSHLHEIVESDKQKFKRKEEMDVLNPILRSLKAAAIAGEKSLIYLTKKLDVALEALENPVEITDEDREENSITFQEHLAQTEMVASIQAAYTAALENVNRVIAGLTRAIQLERFSGGRPWGNKSSVDLGSSGAIGGSDGAGVGSSGNGAGVGGTKPSPRPLEGKELIRALGGENNKTLQEAVNDDYDLAEDGGEAKSEELE